MCVAISVLIAILLSRIQGSTDGWSKATLGDGYYLDALFSSGYYIHLVYIFSLRGSLQINF